MTEIIEYRGVKITVYDRKWWCFRLSGGREFGSVRGGLGLARRTVDEVYDE